MNVNVCNVGDGGYAVTDSEGRTYLVKGWDALIETISRIEEETYNGNSEVTHERLC